MDFWKVLDEGYGISRGFLAFILHASSSSLLSAKRAAGEPLVPRVENNEKFIR